MSVEQDWTFWAESLAGKTLPMTTTPEAGYYKVRRKDGPWEPCVVWMGDDGNWLAQRNGKEVDAHKLWEWCRSHPIDHEAYQRAIHGDGWEADDPTVASMIGHNFGSDLDALRDQIDAAEQGADAYRGINNDEQAGRAQSLRARLNELAGEADKKREAEKRPHFEAAKEVDAKWQPIIKHAKAVANWIREEISAYETLKLRERREAELERQRVEAAREAAEALAREQGRPVDPVREELPPLPPVEPDKVKGSYGRAASVTMERYVSEITDQDALYKFLAGHPDMKKFLLDLAQRVLKAGHAVPGVKILERAKVS